MWRNLHVGMQTAWLNRVVKQGVGGGWKRVESNGQENIVPEKLLAHF